MEKIFISYAGIDRMLLSGVISNIKRGGLCHEIISDIIEVILSMVVARAFLIKR